MRSGFFFSPKKVENRACSQVPCIQPSVANTWHVCVLLISAAEPVINITFNFLESKLPSESYLT